MQAHRDRIGKPRGGHDPNAAVAAQGRGRRASAQLGARSRLWRRRLRRTTGSATVGRKRERSTAECLYRAHLEAGFAARQECYVRGRIREPSDRRTPTAAEAPVMTTISGFDSRWVGEAVGKKGEAAREVQYVAPASRMSSAAAGLR